MIASKNISYSYDGNQILTFPDINCSAGEQSLLLGQSGTGKTTLLHLLGGLLKPKSGEILIDGNNIANMSNEQLDKFRGQNIGIIFQKTHFLNALNVEENLVLAQNLAGLKTNKSLIENVLQRLNVGHKLNAKTSELSQGEQQRVAIARALVVEPKVILADEPTSALDDKNCDEVIQLLEQQAEIANAALLIVTHDNRLKSKFNKQVILE
ncbi:MAG: ATP-binding cassette domain-containing protein [Bacteroidota bacterium]